MTSYQVLKHRLVEQYGGQCVGCGNLMWQVLTWHHLSAKRFDIAAALHAFLAHDHDAHPLGVIREEIEKCLLLCPTCHAALNAGRLVVRPDGWVRWVNNNGRHASACTHAHAPELVAA